MDSLQRQAIRYLKAQSRFEASAERYEEVSEQHENGQASIFRVGLRGLCHVVNHMRVSLDLQSFQTQGMHAGVPLVASEPIEAALRVVDKAEKH